MKSSRLELIDTTRSILDYNIPSHWGLKYICMPRFYIWWCLPFDRPLSTPNMDYGQVLYNPGGFGFHVN